jgi:mono/diheme cytochrome c family protein
MRRGRYRQGAALATLGLLVATLAPLAPARGDQLAFSKVEGGRYLAAAGDCEACHTAEGGKPFAGGRPIETPFGVIYSPNITPDRDTGIGAWTDEQFYRAMHEGISADGKRLYPAFPYPWFTKVTPDDVAAIGAFLKSLPPVRNKPPGNDLTWPLNYRVVMEGWDALFFKAGAFKPNPQKPADWNRGAYLVEGLGHCGACHTPRNMFGAAQKDERFQGASLQDWYAPNLASDLRTGLGSWSTDELVQFLKTGRNDRTVAYGPMSEVITNSTSKLSDDDLKAIAAYLKDMPAAPPKSPPAKPEPKVADAGKAIYVDQCSACHGMNGEGVAQTFPTLKGSPIVQSQDATTVIRLILNGGRAAVTDARPTPVSMPAFGWKLTDAEVAAVASYVRNAWGNAASAVDADSVRDLRHSVASAR